MKTRFIYQVMIVAGMIIALPLFVTAQKFYLKVDAGYGIPISTANLDLYFLYDNVIDSTTNDRTQVNTSLGKGLNFGITGAYRFTDNIALELAASYLLGSKTTGDRQFYEDTWQYSMSASMIRIIPSVVISGKLKEAALYARLGLIVGFGTVKYIAQENRIGLLEEYEWKFNEGLALGLASALGFSYPVSERLSIFAEITNVNMSYAPRKGTLEKATLDGNDILPQLTVSEKEIDFKDNIDFREYDPDATDVPQQSPAIKLPFGSVGINVGIMVSL